MKYGKRFYKVFTMFMLLMLISSLLLTLVYAKNDDLNKSNSTEKQNSAEKTYLIGFTLGSDSESFVIKKGIQEKKIKKKMKLKNQDMMVVDLIEDEVNEYKQDSSVSFIEPDSIVTTTENTLETSLDNEQSITWGNKAIGADLVADKYDGKGIKVAILDTGVSQNHPDLRIAGGRSFVEGTTIQDDNGHGSHVAGVLAAQNNEIGVLGIAPGVDVYALKVLDSTGTGRYSSIIEAINWCIEQHINIISMSFGGNENSEALHQMIQLAHDHGIMLVAAAGNNGQGEETELYPAMYSEVISVGSIDQKLQRSTFSSTGSELDLMAPGENVMSTLQAGYGELSGTSMAVPFVTGSAALLWSSDNELTAEEVKNKLIETATSTGDIQTTGHGIVNIAKALNESSHQDEVQPIETVLLNETFETSKEQFLAMSNSLYRLLAQAQTQNNIKVAKEILNKISTLEIKMNNLINVSDKKKEFSTSDFEDYYIANKDLFSYLQEEYLKTIRQYTNVLQMNSDTESSGEVQAVAEIISYSKNGNQQTISPGQRATVSAELSVQAPTQINIKVKKSDGTVVSTASLNSRYPIFNWTTSTSTATGTYTISFQYPDYPNANEDVFTVYVIAPPTPSVISLDTPVDMEFPAGQYKAYKFTASASGWYRYFTSPYKTENNADTWIGLYGNSSLTNLYESNSNNNMTLYSEVISYLVKGTSCYIVVKNEETNVTTLRTSLTITEYNEPLELSVNQPQDIDTKSLTYTVYKFTPATFDNYLMYTYYYKDLERNGESDTVMYIYSDYSLTNMVDMNDDVVDKDEKEGRFSAIEANLDLNETYYIKVLGYSYGPIYTRLNIINNARIDPVVNVGKPVNVTIPSYKSNFYRFTPSTTGTYKFITGPVSDNAQGSNTMIYLYRDFKFTNLIDYNDDDEEREGLDYSRVEANLIAGNNYYIVLRGSGSAAFNAKFEITRNEDYNYIYDKAGRLIELIYFKDLYRFTITYSYDSNGNLLSEHVEKTQKSTIEDD